MPTFTPAGAITATGSTSASTACRREWIALEARWRHLLAAAAPLSPGATRRPAQRTRTGTCWWWRGRSVPAALAPARPVARLAARRRPRLPGRTLARFAKASPGQRQPPAQRDFRLQSEARALHAGSQSASRRVNLHQHVQKLTSTRKETCSNTPREPIPTARNFSAFLRRKPSYAAPVAELRCYPGRATVLMYLFRPGVVLPLQDPWRRLPGVFARPQAGATAALTPSLEHVAPPPWNRQ